MVDAGSGGVGKAAELLLEEMQRNNQQDLQSKTPGGANADFQRTLQESQPGSAATGVQATSGVTQTVGAQKVLLQAQVNATLPSTKVGAAAATQRSEMANMLEQLVGGQDKMSQIMKLALSGRKLDNQELLAMQAGVYRFSQELDLTGKVIEKATSGIKQTMNTQV